MSLALVTPTPCTFPVSYKRHRPEKTLLYKLIQKNLLTFYQQIEREQENGLPEFVKKEFDEYLKCGILAHGFVRTQCESCKHEKLVAFSCKRRGFCPSCGAKRMAENAAHLVDKVFPHRPLRQWVLSFPYQLRFLFAKDPKVMGEVLTVVNRAISTYLIKKAGLTKKSGAKTGSVTFIQRFGGSLNLNIHFHMMVLDGVYTFNEGRAKFHFITPPSLSEMEGLLTTIAQRVVKLLEKRELIIKDDSQGFMNIDSHGVMDQIHGSSINYRIAFGKYKGRKALTLQTVSSTNPQNQFLAKHSGFSLHAGVACGTHDRKKRERICRYISRPSLKDSHSMPKAKWSINSKKPMTTERPISSSNPWIF